MHTHQVAKPQSIWTILVPLYFALFAFLPYAQADWGGEWKETLSSLWSETKTKTVDLFDPNRWRPKKPVEIGIAYGTEKKAWFEWAVSEFSKTEGGKMVKIELIPLGSVEGAKAVTNQDKRITVWSPASSMVLPLLSEKWEKENGKSPIVSDAPLVLTPMVVVMWEDRYAAFIEKYKEMNFKNIATALAEETGWAGIANKPEWSFFTFGMTAADHSNSGLLGLVLMAYDFWDLRRGLTPAKVMDKSFIEWLNAIEKNLNATETSTGKLMDSMLRFGPSELNGVLVYENLALSSLEKAKGRWGNVKIVYPTRNLWNDNPYYILDVPWSSAEQRDAAKAFQAFLLSKAAQRVARDQYLFRPGSVDVPIVEEGSAFSKLEGIVNISVPTVQRPNAEMLEQLIQLFKRAQH